MIINKEIDYSYKKRELDYKDTLDKIGKEKEVEYKKSLSNYNIYIEKKHTIYAETYDLVEVVKWLVAPPMGLSFSFDFYKSTEEEIINYLKSIEIKDKEIEELIVLKRKDTHSFRNLVLKKEGWYKWYKMRKENQNLINLWRSNLLYFDIKTKKQIEEIIKKQSIIINMWHFHNEMWDWHIEERKEKGKNYKELQERYKELQEEVEKLEGIMRESLWL